MFTFRNNHRFTRRSRRALAALAGGLLLCLAGSAASHRPDCPEISGGTLTVPHGCTYTINDTESYTAVVVQNGGTLNMESTAHSTGILIVRDSITVNGTFNFNESTYAQPIVQAAGPGVDLEGTFGGSGTYGGLFKQTSYYYFEIVGSADVLFSFSPIRITCPIRCVGSTATFTLSGDVENDGTIRATNGGDVTFDSNSTINAACSGLFEVTHANSIMLFDMSSSAAITSGADFNVSAGRMQYSQTLSTTGGYRQTGGTCQADAGKSFTATGAY
jgi:hypothetical protein